MRKDGVEGRAVRAAALTAVAVLGNELLFDRLLGIPTPVATLAVVTYAAFVWGLAPGLASAAIASAYGVYFYRSPGPVFAYTTGDLLRTLMFVATAFAIATMVGLLRRAARAAEDARREQLLFASALNESLAEGVYATDSTGRITFCNSAAAHMLGYAPGELLGRHTHDLIHYRRADGTPAPAEEYPLLGVARSGQPYRDDDDVFTRKDGAFLPVAYSSAPLVRSGTVAGAVVAFRATSERKRADAELRRSEQRFRSLVQNSSELICVIAADTTILYQSPAAERVLGYRPEAMVGRRALEYVHPEDADCVRTAVAEILGSDGPGEPVELRARHADGSWRDLEAVANDLLDDPAVGGIVLNVRDITERKQAERDLARRNAYLTALHETTLALLARSEPSELLEAITERAGGLLGTPHGYVYLLEEGGEALRVRVGTGLFARYVGYAVGRGEGLAGRVWETGRAVVVEDYDAWPGRRPGFERGVMRAVAGVPLESAGRVIGVLALAYAEEGRLFGPDELDVLGRFAELASVVLENARLAEAAEAELRDRRRAEEALRASEERYRAVVEQTSEGIYLVDADTLRIVESNAAYQRLLGYTAPELEQLTLYDIVAHDRESVDAHVRALLENGRHVAAGRRQRRKDGTLVDVEARSSLISYGGRRVMCVVVHDVSERIRAQEALRASEERYELAVAGSNDGIWDWDLTTNAVYYSPRWKRMLGYEDSEIPSAIEEWRSRIHPDDLERVLGVLDAYLRGETAVYEVEHRLLHRDGAYRWILSRGAAVRDAVGRAYRMAGSHTDVTERRRAEEDLRRSETNLAEAQRIAHLGSWEWDIGANKERWSDEVYRIFGFAPRAFTPTYEIFLGTIHPDDRRMVREAVDAALQGERPYGIDHRVVRPDGEERVVHEQAEVMRDDEGQPLRMVGTVHDITERRRAEQEVERVLEIRNQFLSIASHELRTPVTLLKGYAQLLEERARRSGDAASARPLATMNRQVDRMARLIDDLLDVSRIESGKVQFDMRPFELGAAVREIVHEVAESARGFTVRFENRGGEVWVHGDRMRIQQVVTNLLTNAVKYSGESRDVEACLERRDGRAAVSVTDAGIGIPERQQRDVFELYFRGANASATNYGGLGLGLFISKTILDRHGGEIAVESREGAGSTFSFSLPILEEGAPRD